MAFVTVARVEDVPPGTITHVRAGDEEIAVANVDNEFFATQGHCLHLKGPLGHGELHEHVLSCPWHGWQYDVRTGLNEFDHAIQLRTFDVRVADSEIQVDV
jgi:nitrite reductase/ring-hydroxylating ferredoxin subunit